MDAAVLMLCKASDEFVGVLLELPLEALWEEGVEPLVPLADDVEVTEEVGGVGAALGKNVSFPTA